MACSPMSLLGGCDDAEVEALWESMLGSLAGEAADGEQHTFAGAGHYLQLERAHEVAEVILGIVAAAEQ